MAMEVSVELRPLLLGYLSVKKFVVERKVLADVEFLVRNLRSHGISVDFKGPDEVDVLLDYWKKEKYLEVRDEHLYLDTNIIDEDFVTQKLFDRRSINIDTIVSAYKEVL